MSVMLEMAPLLACPNAGTTKFLKSCLKLTSSVPFTLEVVSMDRTLRSRNKGFWTWKSMLVAEKLLKRGSGICACIPDRVVDEGLGGNENIDELDEMGELGNQITLFFLYWDCSNERDEKERCETHCERRVGSFPTTLSAYILPGRDCHRCDCVR